MPIFTDSHVIMKIMNSKYTLSRWVLTLFKLSILIGLISYSHKIKAQEIVSLSGVPDVGSGLDGRYWQAGIKSIDNLDDKGGEKDVGLKIIRGAHPTGIFKATGLTYQGGNDLTEIRDWLQSDGESYDGMDGNMDDGLLSLTGFIRIDIPGDYDIRSESDDGSIIWIAGERVVDNDGSHGSPGPSPDGFYNFKTAGLYPIEVAWFNGDWTNDSGEHGGANLNVLLDGDPVPAEILYGASDVGGIAVSVSAVSAEKGAIGLAGQYWASDPKGFEFGEGSQGPVFQTTPEDNHGIYTINSEPQGTFVSTNVEYSGNDLTPIVEWLGADADSFEGQEGNLNDGMVQLRGLIDISAPGWHDFRSASDDGSVVRIGNQVVVNNDGGHGAPGPAPDGSAFFTKSGLYPIEVNWFNGNWTNDAGDHGGANITLTMDEWSLDGIIFHSLEDAITLPSLVKPEPNTEGDSGGGFVIDSTKTQMALPLPQAPVIDGVLDSDEGWAFAGGAAQNFWSVRYDEALDDLLRGGGFGDGNPDEIWDETDIQFNMYAGVFENDLYVAVEVTDDWIVNDNADPNSEDGSTWEDDSVEIFIDGDNSNFEERNTAGIPEVVDTGGQFVITANNARRDKEAGDPSFGENADWYAKTDLTDTGYVAEFRISLDAIGNPEPGQVIGFTVGVNDDDEISRRQITWAGSPHTESTYGNLFIGERSYTAPKTASPTLDGVVNAAEYEGALPIVLNSHTGSYHVGVGNDEWEEGDHSLTGWVVHDEDAIYVAVIAEDDVISTDTAEAGSEDGSTWVDDSIEVFFDADDSNDAGRDNTAQFEGQFVLTPNGARRDNEANNPTWGENADWFAATTEADGGYQMEFKFSKAALLGVSEGDRLGFNIAINDDDGSGRKSQLNWAGAPHLEFSYGSLLLGGAATGGGGGGPANVSLTRSGTGIVLEWEGGGSLQTAPAVTGPWSEVSGASSGVQIEVSGREAYYRVR